MSGRRLPALLLLLVSTACSPGGSAEIVPRDRFVAANLALRAIPDTAHGADSLRAAALKKTGVTPPQLRAWVRGHRRDTGLLAEVWREIADSLQKRDSVALARAAPAVPAPTDTTVVPPAGPLNRPTDGVTPYALPERDLAPPPAPVHTEPPRPMTKKLDVRGQMPIEPDSGETPRR